MSLNQEMPGRALKLLFIAIAILWVEWVGIKKCPDGHGNEAKKREERASAVGIKKCPDGHGNTKRKEEKHHVVGVGIKKCPDGHGNWSSPRAQGYPAECLNQEMPGRALKPKYVPPCDCDKSVGIKKCPDGHGNHPPAIKHSIGMGKSESRNALTGIETAQPRQASRSNGFVGIKKCPDGHGNPPASAGGSSRGNGVGIKKCPDGHGN